MGAWIISHNGVYRYVESDEQVDLVEEPPPPDPTVTAGPYPFLMPSTATLRARPRKVFSHYFTQFVRSFENAYPGYYANYLRPGGDPSNSFAYGGYFRNMPWNAYPARPRPGDWQEEDMKDQIRDAIAAGYDGWTMNVLTLSGYHWERIDRMYRACSELDTGFKIMIMPDAFAGGTASHAALADRVQYLHNTYPNTCFKLGDGRHVVSPFMAEGETAVWWRDWINIMAGRGIPIAFAPCFLNYDANVGTFQSTIPGMYGASVWGDRSMNGISRHIAQAQNAASRGLVWMHPLAIQDNRPREALFDESSNSETFREMYRQADQVNALWTQVITWNDYGEAAEIEPSVNLRYAGIDLSAVLNVRYKMGALPAITRDTVYLSHRIHPHAATATGGQTSYMRPRGNSTPPRDTIEILTFLRFASAVRVTIGSVVHNYTAPAGMSARTVPLSLGTPAVRVTAPDGYVTDVVSVFQARAQNTVQDLQYRYISSGRDGTSVRT